MFGRRDPFKDQQSKRTAKGLPDGFSLGNVFRRNGQMAKPIHRAAPYAETLSTIDARSEHNTEDNVSENRRDSSDSNESQKTIEVVRPSGRAQPSAASPINGMESLSRLLDSLLQPQRRPGRSHITTEESFFTSGSSANRDQLPNGLGGSMSLKDIMESALGKMGDKTPKRYQIHAKWSPLHASASQGKLAQVKALVSRGADVNAREDDGWSPLLLAAQNGHVDVVRELIDNGANVNHTGDDGVTALRQASQGGHVEIVELLLSRKADPDIMTENSGSALGAAIAGSAKPGKNKQDMMRIITALLRAGARTDLVDRDGDSPLGVACFLGATDAARLLLEAGADVNASDNRRVSCLSNAAYQADSGMVKLLLEYHAQVNSMDSNDWTPLHLTVQFLKKETLEVVKLLVEAGSDVNARTEINATALHIAAQVGDIDILQYLIGKGANVNARTTSGRTPIFQAATNEHYEAVEILAAAGADVHITTAETQINILHSAIVRNNPKMVEQALRLGVNPNVKARGNDTPLGLASMHDDDEIFFILLDHGANPS